MSLKGGKPAGNSSGKRSSNSLRMGENAAGQGVGWDGVGVTATKANSGRVSCNSCSNWDLDMINKFCFEVVGVAGELLVWSVAGKGNSVILRPSNIKELVFVLPLWITSRSNCQGRPRII